MASEAPEKFEPQNQTTCQENKGDDPNSDSTAEGDDHGDGICSIISTEDIRLDQLCNEVEQFLSTLPKEKVYESDSTLEIPNNVPNLLEKINSTIDNPSSKEEDEQQLLLSAIDVLSRLIDSIGKFKSQSCVSVLLNEASSVLQRSMVYMEDELRYILAEAAAAGGDGIQDEMGVEEDETEESSLNSEGKRFPYYSDVEVSRIRSIVRIMISTGHEVECLSVFVENRRGAFREEINKKHGFEKMSMDEVQKMPWDQLEAEVAKCNRALKHLLTHLLKGEHSFYKSVFDVELEFDPPKSKNLFSDLTRSVLTPFIDFAHSIAMTKRSTEKLFKFLDMYEALRDVELEINSESCTNEMIDELKAELIAARTKLGEAAVAIFTELEMSIKSDNTKQPIPSGAVHPLIRYTMNYVKYACEYKDTLEEVFLHHHHHHHNNNKEPLVDQNNHPMTPFTAQLMRILDLLDTNLEAKSNLYKDIALRYVFLMNNGRYMLQKIRGSPEIHQVVRDPWCRRRSSDMRQYHKGYQRETWSRVLQCLNPEGLQVKGKVDKPTLKDRFKNFNQQFDDIHKTQTAWVVSDEQLQSELRVSISAVMIPAYRGFLARYGQIFTPGRQSEKYIKYQPEDIENAIDELFDGNPTSMPRRR